MLRKALLRFDKHQEYQKMLEDYRRRVPTGAMWQKMAKILPLQGKELGQAMKAFGTLPW